MLIEKLDAIKKIAKKDHLTVRMMLAEDSQRWSIKLTSLYMHQPLCTGFSEDLEIACDQLLEKAERSIAPYREKMRAASKRAERDGIREERRMRSGRYMV